MTQTHFAPAKINLFLAITGRRADGFHDLVSVVAPIAFGDTLVVTPAPAGEFRLSCSDADLPCDDSNLVLKAARAFVARTGWGGGATIHVEKKVPIGAGLGGGSSDAAATLRALNALAGSTVFPEVLAEIAASVGSDCSLFLLDGPVVMRGRGERVESLSEGAVARMRGRRVLLFKPSFGVSTAWAYRRMAEMATSAAASDGSRWTGRPQPATKADRDLQRGGGTPPTVHSSPYISELDAEQRVQHWIANGGTPLESLLFNNLERPAFEKFVALPALLERLAGEFELQPRMSGSGSACFALLPHDFDPTPVCARIREAWGDSAFISETRIA